MKRVHIIIYLFLFAAFINTSCEKNGSESANAGGGSNNGAGGSLARITIVGNYLYALDCASLITFDITNPAKPVRKGNFTLVDPNIETIFPYKNKLFIGGRTGMFIYSLDDPANPKKEGSVTHVRACDPVVSNDSVSYVTLRSFGTNCGNVANVLNVYDIKNLKEPKLVKTVVMKMPHGLGIKNKTLYVCEAGQGMVVFDLENPYNPVKKKEITGHTFTDVIPYGSVLIAYVTDGVCFYDITNPQEPVFLSKVKG
ncbi:MAG TPA: hypothetical protein VD993_02715 [Chitinophagaceae bacterium]|nr:hypothetical protein [Chitinophagaceae bacterium]